MNKPLSEAQLIQRSLPGVSHDQVLEFVEFLQLHPYLPIGPFLEFVKRYWAGVKVDRAPHHNKTKARGAAYA